MKVGGGTPGCESVCVWFSADVVVDDKAQKHLKHFCTGLVVRGTL